MKESWECGCGLIHHLDPGVTFYKCAFCGHVKGEDAPDPPVPRSTYGLRADGPEMEPVAPTPTDENEPAAKAEVAPEQDASAPSSETRPMPPVLPGQNLSTEGQS